MSYGSFGIADCDPSSIVDSITPNTMMMSMHGGYHVAMAMLVDGALLCAIVLKTILLAGDTMKVC